VFAREGDREWLARAYGLLRREYDECWMAPRHTAHAGLAGYHSADDTIFWSEAESGWDFTPRFGDARHCLAADLNALLFKYETDFAAMAETLGRSAEAAEWLKAARRRREQVDALLWNEADGLYYDYDFSQGRQRPVKSLAAYFALWAGMASREQATRLAANLTLFEQDWGLTTCDRNYAEFPSLLVNDGALLPNERKQWNWPNGWAPLHWIAVAGLYRYGYETHARRIAQKFCRLVEKIFTQTGRLWEKYNVVNESLETTDERYQMPPMFGWTAGVYVALATDIGSPFKGPGPLKPEETQ
jgi:alpha,alpha-trehalase